MVSIISIFVAIFGLLVGSFLSAYTYRLPREIGISKGRSKCPKCRKTIFWYDNIPLISYLLLSGKSRCCKKKISLRYPLIEFATSITFVFMYLTVIACNNNATTLCADMTTLGMFSIFYLVILVFILIAIFVIDLEHQIIPDNLVFILLSVVFVLVLARHETFFPDLLAGFGASAFLLFLNLITKGQGMGLGDVKLVIPLGMILGTTQTLYWMTLSFVLGAIVGVALILIGKARFGKHIAFGPFLILGFVIVYVWGVTSFIPYPIY